eukprot:scaffold4369_cov63-Phaeocystis_antarctica.AAC.1
MRGRLLRARRLRPSDRDGAQLHLWRRPREPWSPSRDRGVQGHRRGPAALWQAPWAQGRH